MRPNERLAQQNFANFDTTPQRVSARHALVDDNHDIQNGPQFQKLLSLNMRPLHVDTDIHTSREQQRLTLLVSALLSALCPGQTPGYRARVFPR